jgi:hypothetical protein
MKQRTLGRTSGKKVAPVARLFPWTDPLCRSLSPTLVAEHETALPSKALLRSKLHELYAQLATEN